MYTNNSRDSSELMGCNPLQHSCNLIGKYHAVDYIFLFQPLAKQNCTYGANTNME